MPILHNEETKTCPYNSAHQILPSRMPEHLVKCRRSHPNSDLEICTYDANHHVPKQQLKAHEKMCLENLQLHLQKAEYRTGNQNMIGPPVTNFLVEEGLNGDEDWILEAQQEFRLPYDPMKATEKKMVIRHKPGGTKSERKAYRKAEQERLTRLEEEQLEKEMKHLSFK